jgi:hypothetical protein
MEKDGRKIDKIRDLISLDIDAGRVFFAKKLR